MLLYKDYYNFDLQKYIGQIDLSQVVTRMRYLVMVIDCFWEGWVSPLILTRSKDVIIVIKISPIILINKVVHGDT